MEVTCRLKDEQSIPAEGNQCTGIIMYHPEGYMSAQFMHQGRKAYDSGDLHEGTKEEMVEAAFGYLAYPVNLK